MTEGTSGPLLGGSFQQAFGHIACLHMGSSEGEPSTSVHMCKELPRGSALGNTTGSVACSVSFTAVMSETLLSKLRLYCHCYAQTVDGQLCSSSPQKMYPSNAHISFRT